MKEEELFDREIRKKIESLEQVPELDWDEDLLWDKLEPKLIKPSFSRFFFLGFLLVLSLALLCLPVIKKAFLPDTDEEVRLTNQPLPPVELSNLERIKENDAVLKNITAAQPKVEGNTSPKLSAVKRNSPKLAGQRRSKVRSSKIHLSTTFPNALTEQKNDTTAIMLSPSVDSVAEEASLPEVSVSPAYQNDSIQGVDGPLEEDETKQANAVSDTEAIPITRALEVGLSAQSAGYLIGVSKGYKLMPRLSFVYGLRIRKYINYQTNFLESTTSDVFKNEVQVPLMLRYYFTPPENKFQGFIYGGLLTTWSLNQPDSDNTHDLDFKSGLEIRYKYYQSKNGRSASYLFMQLPLYQRNINNVHSSPAQFNPLHKK